MKCTIQYKTKQNDTPPFLTYFAAGHTTLRMTAKPFFISILQTFCNQLPIEPVQPPCPWLVGEPSNGMCENKLGFCLNWCPASLPRSYDTQNPKNKFHSSTKTIQHRRVSVLFLHFGLLSPSGDLGIGLVWDNPTGPHRTTTFQSDCWNPLQTELNYLWCCA